MYILGNLTEDIYKKNMVLATPYSEFAHPVKFVMKLYFEKLKGGMSEQYQEGGEYFIKRVRLG